MKTHSPESGLKQAGLLASLLSVLSLSQSVVAAPQGGEISAGSGSIAQQGPAVTNVIQNTHRMAIDWQSFNLEVNESVNFNQPSASAAVLNRIHDQNPSQIFGAINANGRVFLANPNGIVFGQTATVNVGALIAAGMNISNEDFMAGNYNFTAGENGAGVIVNRGLINAATGGSVGLLGSTVINEGIIVADYGNIELASGNRAVVNFDGDGLLNIQVSEDVINNAVENDAAVSNRGSLLADGGQVVLTAHAAKDVFDNAINNEGIIKAARIDNTGGVIRLVGNSGTVLHSGEISAKGENGTGGTVHVLGDRVGLIDDASIDVSGERGGGTVLVGGDYQGRGDTRTASRTYVGANASINADAVESGDGGQVVVWADELTHYHGSISSRGGSRSGNGGDVEVSGKGSLDFDGAVDVAAPNGVGGTVLLDPQNIVLGAGPTSDPPGTVNDNQPGPDVAFTDDQNDSYTIDVDDVSGFSELFLQALNDITLETDLTMTDALGSIIFQAENDININAELRVTGSGSITLTADFDGGGAQDDGTVRFGASGSAITAGGDITITTSEFRIENPAATVINAGGGEVSIRSSTVSKIIEIGSDAGTGINDPNMDIDVAEIGQISAGTLTIGAGSHTGQIQVESNDVSLSKVSTLQLLNEGDIHINSNLAVAGGEIILNADVNNNGGTDSISQANASAVTANSVILKASNGIGTTTDSLITKTGTLNFDNTTSAGVVNITNDAGAGSTVTISGNTAGAQTEISEASGNLAVGSTGITTSGGASVALDAAQSLNVNASITTSGQVELTAGSISGNAPGVVTADTVILNASSGIGTSAVSLQTEASTLSFDNTTSAGVVNITNDTGAGSTVTISGNTADNQIDITEASGSITVGSAGIATNGSASIAMDAAQSLNVNASIATSGQVELTAGNITGNASGVVTADTLILNASSGIGTSAVSLQTEAGTLSFDNTTSAGVVNITNDTGAGSTVTVSGNTTDNQIDITEAAGSITVASAGIATNGSASVALDAAQSLNVNSAITTSGQVDLTAGNTVSGNASGVITAGTLNTSSGTGTDLTAATHVIEAFSASNTGDGNVSLLNNSPTGLLTINSIVQSGTGQVTITEPGKIDVLANSITAGTNTVELRSDRMALSSINSIDANTVSLQTNSVGRSIDLGSGTDNADALELSQNELNSITAETLSIGEATSGPITVSAPVSLSNVDELQLTASGVINVNSSLSNVGGTVQLTADDVAVPGNVMAGFRVILQPLTAGRQIDLGLAAANTLGLTDVEIGHINTNTLEIGSISAGDITISADIVPNVDALHLVTAGSVSGITGGILGNRNLAIEAGGSVNITAASTDVALLAVAAGQDVTFVDSMHLNVGDVDVVSDVISGISGNNISLTSTTGNLFVYNGTAGADINASGSIQLESLQAYQYIATETGSVIHGAGTHTYTSDRMFFQGDIDANGQRVILQSSSPGYEIWLGATSVSTGQGILELVNSVSLDKITADTVVIGNASAGNITVKTDTTLDTARISNLHLVSGAGIDGVNAGIFGGVNLAVEAAGDVTFNAAGINTLAGSSGNIFQLADTFNDLVIGDVDGVQGVTAANDVDLRSVSGAILDGNGAGLNVSAGRNFIAEAVTGIGAGDALETSVAFLQVTNNTSGGASSGDIQISEADHIYVDIAENTNGSIDIQTVDGAISVHRSVASGGPGPLDRIKTQGNSGSISFTSNGTSGAANIRVNDNISAVDDININAATNIEFDPGLNLTTTNGDITLQANGTVTADGALTIVAADALNITQVLTANGNTSLTASLMEITENITVNGGFLRIISDNDVTISPDITLTSGDSLSIEHPDDSTGSTIATEAGANLTLRGKSIYLPGKLNVTNGNLTLDANGDRSLGLTAGNLQINNAVSTTTSGDISITAADLIMDSLSASISSASSVTIADNGTGNGMLLAGGQTDSDSLHISKNEYDKIAATRIILSSADLTIQESFNPSTSVPLTINAANVTIPQADRQITLSGSLDFSDSIVTAGPGLAIDVNQFTMNNQLNVSGALSITSAAGITMGLPSEISTTNGQVDLVTTGGDVLLGLIDAGNANVNVTASAGSILNNNGVYTDITQSKTNVRSANVTLDANDRIGVSSTDAITLDINSNGLITLDFGAPKAYINNLQNTRIVNRGAGDVAIGLIFSSEIIGRGHYVGVNYERDPPAADSGAEEVQQGAMISVLGADYQAIPLDDEEEVTSTLAPTVPVLIHTTRGWEFKAPSRSRPPDLPPGGDEQQPEHQKGIRYIDWL